jgi:hypothetical protein
MVLYAGVEVTVPFAGPVSAAFDEKRSGLVAVLIVEEAVGR